MLSWLLAAMMTNPDQICDNCGRPRDTGDRFCTRCGSPLPQAAASVETPPVAETAEGGEVPWTPVHVTAGLFIFLGLLIAAGSVARAVGTLNPAHEQALQIWIGVHLLALCAGAVVWFMGARRAVSPARALGIVAPITSLGMSAALVLAALAVSILSNYLYALVVDILGLESLRLPEIDDATIFPGMGILLSLQALAIVTPISEELLFRGFVLRGLLPSIGHGPAVVATALLFSVLHLEPQVMIPLFITGLVLGMLYVRTGSVWPCVAAHAGQNTLALLATRFL